MLEDRKPGINLPTKLFLKNEKISDIDEESVSDLGESDTFLPTTSNYTLSSSASMNPQTGCLCRVIKKGSWVFNIVLPLVVVFVLLAVAYFCRDYARLLLMWIERQNPWMVFAIFMLMFTLVSFPVTVGYLVLMISSGYLFGFLKGLLTVILGANLGIFIAHTTITKLRTKIPIHRLIKNEIGHAILRVISGNKAFKVVLFTRLTPIPFGIQNTIFGVSSISPRTYHTATFLGLLPAQIINVYLGSTLRSMHEVLNNHSSSAVTGYISLGVEVIFGIGLMLWVIQKARSELAQALLSDVGPDDKNVDINV
ncbi:hypothetical protein ACFFRR_011029 [Megaselia abdita]